MIYIIPTDTCYWICCSIDDIKSYEKIYKIKKRDKSKPLAVMVYDYKYLKKISDLNNQQIKFLKEYKYPFTILTNSDYINHWIKYKNELWVWFFNDSIYNKIAIRVAHNDIQKKYIWKVWPIFLTSANFSWKKEIYTIKGLENTFKDYLEKKEVEIIWNNNLKETVASDIFEFVWDTLEINYFRKKRA